MRSLFHFPYIKHDFFFVSGTHVGRGQIGLRREQDCVAHASSASPTSDEIISEIGALLAAHLAFVILVTLVLAAVGIQ